ncbi:hypothetical protein NC652_013836 [Populus alba x Populus x berolinensis]|nr:hypothetical protein NC652_013836 [Populus alba x Populus x berolinensis]
MDGSESCTQRPHDRAGRLLPCTPSSFNHVFLKIFLFSTVYKVAEEQLFQTMKKRSELWAQSRGDE